MSQDLINRLKKTRISRVELDGLVFIIRRPTDLEYLELQERGINQRAIFDFVEGWENVKEMDIFSGASDEKIEFSRSLFSEWVSDHPRYWNLITDEVIGSYTRHIGLVEESKKNLDGGLIV